MGEKRDCLVQLQHAKQETEEEKKEDKMDEDYFSTEAVIEEHKRILKNKGDFVPLEEI